MSIRERNIRLSGIAGLIVLSGILGHFVSGAGIITTPALVFFSAYVLCFSLSPMSIVNRALALFCVIALNDLMIRLWAGGDHDAEGMAFYYFFLGLGLLPSFFLLFYRVWRGRNEHLQKRLLAVFVFIVLTTLHFYIFSDVGLTKRSI